MEIDKETAEKLLNDSRNLAVSQPSVVYVRPPGGVSGGGRKTISPMLKTIIGVAAHHDTDSNVADAFGVSRATVNRTKKGNTGDYKHDPELKETIDEIVRKEKVDLREQALSRLSSMFASVITEQNLGGLKVREAVGAARDIATIVDKLTPRASGTNVAVFVHAPRVKSEEEYGEIVEVAHRPTEESKLT